MIKNRADLRFYLQEDAKQNWFKSKTDYWLSLIYGNENAYVLHYLKLLRHCEYHRNNRSSCIHNIFYFFYKIRLNHLGVRLHLTIPENKCGYGIRIIHIAGGGGVLLNVKSVGNYCEFNSGVLLGTKNKKGDLPSVGDYTVFGPGSKAFGDIKIGNNVFVAPGAIVYCNVEDDTIVGGVPAKVIKKKQCS